MFVIKLNFHFPIIFAVVFDQTGTSKCYGFVRFGNESEQLTALATMMNAVGLGGKPIKVIIRKLSDYEN